MTATLIKLLANVLIGSDLFNRILGIVIRWEDEKIAGAQKRSGVLDEMQVIGLQLAQHLQNLAIELAVSYLKQKAK